VMITFPKTFRFSFSIPPFPFLKWGLEVLYRTSREKGMRKQKNICRKCGEILTIKKAARYRESAFIQTIVVCKKGHVFARYRLIDLGG